MAINGLFEIHITVDQSQGLFNLWKYTYNKKDFKLILAVAENGEQKEQYMISKWKNGTYSEVIQKAKNIAIDMKQNDILVSRIKVESMAHNNGVPETEEQYTEFMQERANQHNSVYICGRPYFEYHAKIDLKDNNIDDLTKWCNEKIELCNNIKMYPYSGYYQGHAIKSGTYVAYSFNLCGSKTPLLTIRVYDHGRAHAIEQKNIILDDLKNKGFKIIGDIQQEFSIYDDNENMDKGWLI